METAVFSAQTHRLIASRWPTVGVFDDCMDQEAVQVALELESLTNDRLADTAALKAIPVAEYAFGQQGATIAMAAFLHGRAGRFNLGRVGAWYASLDVRTAIAETTHHHEKRLRASSPGFPALIQMRELLSTPDATLTDIREKQEEAPHLYHDSDYGQSQTFGETIRSSGGDGIWFSSVRWRGGQNIVLYKPRLVVPVLQGDHYEYAWERDGTCEVCRLTNVA